MVVPPWFIVPLPGLWPRRCRPATVPSRGVDSARSASAASRPAASSIWRRRRRRKAMRRPPDLGPAAPVDRAVAGRLRRHPRRARGSPAPAAAPRRAARRRPPARSAPADIAQGADRGEIRGEQIVRPEQGVEGRHVAHAHAGLADSRRVVVASAVKPSRRACGRAEVLLGRPSDSAAVAKSRSASIIRFDQPRDVAPFPARQQPAEGGGQRGADQRVDDAVDDQGPPGARSRCSSSSAMTEAANEVDAVVDHRIGVGGAGGER